MPVSKASAAASAATRREEYSNRSFFVSPTLVHVVITSGILRDNALSPKN